MQFVRRGRSCAYGPPTARSQEQSLQAVTVFLITVLTACATTGIEKSEQPDLNQAPVTARSNQVPPVS